MAATARPALHHRRRFRPWSSGELQPRYATEPDWYDPAALLRTNWEHYATPDADAPPDPDESAELAESLAPFTDGWPGTASAAEQPGDPDRAARALARELLANNAHLRIGLVPAATGAEALTACGWTGPVNHEGDIAKVSAVLLDRERRYGTRLVQVGFAELELSVGAPPQDDEPALRIAAEHAAFCPDTSPRSRHDRRLRPRPGRCRPVVLLAGLSCLRFFRNVPFTRGD
ncbi:DUF4253 domain-containing protein [Kitasatospora sp. NPDC004615]|uniref:DUF4253 domain-containing protein n=1 Tax=Kitasatospora sp. NPDC004615 TaxID=3364017 RepID=UPI0036839F0A